MNGVQFLYRGRASEESTLHTSTTSRNEVGRAMAPLDETRGLGDEGGTKVLTHPLQIIQVARSFPYCSY